MANENESLMGSLARELVTPGVYKRNLGRTTRQVTFAVLAVAVAVGAWSLSAWGTQFGPGTQFALPSAVLLAGLWLCYRAVNVPRFAEFLIAVENEMAKVSWPSWGELARGATVVIVTIFALAAILFAFDIIWRWALGALGVIG